MKVKINYILPTVKLKNVMRHNIFTYPNASEIYRIAIGGYITPHDGMVGVVNLCNGYVSYQTEDTDVVLVKIPEFEVEAGNIKSS